MKSEQSNRNFYYDANNQYPPSPGYYTSKQGSAWLIGISPTYIATVPIDPLNIGVCTSDPTFPWGGGTNYCYVYGYPQYTFPQTYDLNALLEDPNNPQRCGVKLCKYHTYLDGNVAWCGGAPGLAYSPYMYADH